jgi:hypothetical protein
VAVHVVAACEGYLSRAGTRRSRSLGRSAPPKQVGKPKLFLGSPQSPKFLCVSVFDSAYGLPFGLLRSCLASLGTALNPTQVNTPIPPDYAIHAGITFPPTSVSRKSRPWNRCVSFR